MKKALSLALSLLMIVCTFSVSFSANATQYKMISLDKTYSGTAKFESSVVYEFYLPKTGKVTYTLTTPGKAKTTIALLISDENDAYMDHFDLLEGKSKATRTYTLKGGHFYYFDVYIKGYEDYTGPYSQKYSVKANYKPNPPKATSITSLTSKSKSVTVKWKKVGAATGYQIQYATNKNMKKAKTVTVSGKNLAKQIKKLKKGKKYYFRVRTCQKVHFYDNTVKTLHSKWSAKKAIKCK